MNHIHVQGDLFEQIKNTLKGMDFQTVENDTVMLKS